MALEAQDETFLRVVSVFSTLKLQQGLESASPSTPCALNSVKIFELILGLEDEFRFRIPEDHLTAEMLATLGTISDYVRGRMQSERPS